MNPNHPAMHKPRRITSVGATHFTFEDGMEAGFRSAQAWDFSIPGYATLTLNSATTHGAPAIVRYTMDLNPHDQGYRT